MAWRFAPLVEAYKCVTAYHAGDGVWIEIDVLMKEEERLGRAHDVAETLQYCLEGLGEVDRAFVTVDCEFFLLSVFFLFLLFWCGECCGFWDADVWILRHESGAYWTC